MPAAVLMPAKFSSKSSQDSMVLYKSNPLHFWPNLLWGRLIYQEDYCRPIKSFNASRSYNANHAFVQKVSLNKTVENFYHWLHRPQSCRALLQLCWCRTHVLNHFRFSFSANCRASSSEDDMSNSTAARACATRPAALMRTKREHHARNIHVVFNARDFFQGFQFGNGLLFNRSIPWKAESGFHRNRNNVTGNADSN